MEKETLISGIQPKPMRVEINFYWAGDRFQWEFDWPLPMLPRKGDSFNFYDFVEEGYIKDWHDVEFKGTDIYTGMKTSLEGLFCNDFWVYVKEVIWHSNYVWITLETSLFGEHERASEHFIPCDPNYFLHH
jgi:hypothetical protein